MAKANVVYLHVWSGNAQHARDAASARYPGVEIREFPHRRLRESTFAGRIRLLQGFHGRALVVYFQSLTHLRYGLLMQCVHFLHHCDETVLCDSDGRWQPMRSSAIFRAAPRVLFSSLRDIRTLAFWWLYLRLRPWHRSPVPFDTSTRAPQIAYLVSSPGGIGASGGAISHIRGFLIALKQSGQSCRVFTGTPLAQNAFPNELVYPPDQERHQPYFFWQAALLSYNFAFALGVQRRLAATVPGAFYQRHSRFSIAGALLSRRLRVPLILEYNGPEVWIADHWDPTPFRGLIALCEQVTLRSAARIVVVSEALKTGLLNRGFAADRIRVNPNGVDGEFFCPGPGRASGRNALQVQPGEILIGFVGSFSLWHGIEVLQQAITSLLSNPQPCPLRFVLMGEGLLHGEMRSALAAWEQTGAVVFTGSLAPSKVVEYLDACDILASPHIPMPDGSRFFGSPTKLFEYMAMGKAIIASRLEQLAEGLVHDQTGWLVAPGSLQELTEAILRLALDPVKRETLGSAARQAALQNHSWVQNVAVALRDHPSAAQDEAASLTGTLALPRAAGNTG